MARKDPSNKRDTDDKAGFKWATEKPAGAGEDRVAKRRKLRRLVLIVLPPAALMLLWTAVHRIPWLGPLVADSLRAVIGAEAVTTMEDLAYAAQDRIKRLLSSDEKPKAYWEVPKPSSKRAAPLPTRKLQGCEIGPFQPRDPGPMHTSWSAPGDGRWVGVEAGPLDRFGSPAMYKTLLHPDKQRSWAAVSLVAVDLRRVKLHMMAGKREPKSSTKEAYGYKRAALIPPRHRGALLAAFNGGFKAVHGQYGMKIDGVTLIKPRSISCGIAMLAGEELVIGDWARLAKRADKAVWWRQTPSCMVDQGKLHPGLVSEKNTYWGATLNGHTVIRRSAIGISADGKVLYSGIGDHTTAPAIALAMKHAGAAFVAQLDVNWSYPKLVLYKHLGLPDPIATKLCDGFEFTRTEYLQVPSPRDFFYLTLKSDRQVRKAVCGGEASRAKTRRDSAG